MSEIDPKMEALEQQLSIFNGQLKDAITQDDISFIRSQIKFTQESIIYLRKQKEGNSIFLLLQIPSLILFFLLVYLFFIYAESSARENMQQGKPIHIVYVHVIVTYCIVSSFHSIFFLHLSYTSFSLFN